MPGSYAADANSQHSHPDAELLPGETVAWESCGRIVVQERADFWEFVACNLIFVCVALVLVLLRSKRMNAMHARQLAARIGLARGYG
jgi:Jumping translocation breakpoint protein (JTB)